MYRYILDQSHIHRRNNFRATKQPNTTTQWGCGSWNHSSRQQHTSLGKSHESMYSMCLFYCNSKSVEWFAHSLSQCTKERVDRPILCPRNTTTRSQMSLCPEKKHIQACAVSLSFPETSLSLSLLLETTSCLASCLDQGVLFYLYTSPGTRTKVPFVPVHTREECFVCLELETPHQQRSTQPEPGAPTIHPNQENSYKYQGSRAREPHGGVWRVPIGFVTTDKDKS